MQAKTPWGLRSLPRTFRPQHVSLPVTLYANLVFSLSNFAMPHAAIYVLVESGRTSLHASPSGALAIPKLAFRGPEATTARIRSMTPAADWMTEDECEGGMLVDVDRGTLLLFGGDEIAYQCALQREFVRMLRQVWVGWSVRWAHRGLIDLAEAAGAERLGRREEERRSHF